VPASTLKSAAQGTAELRRLRKARAAKNYERRQSFSERRASITPDRDWRFKCETWSQELGWVQLRLLRRNLRRKALRSCKAQDSQCSKFYERRVSRRHDRLEYDKVGRSGLVSFGADVENCNARLGGAAGTCKAGAEKSSVTAGLGRTRPTWRW